MQLPNIDLAFWGSVLGATLFRVLSSSATSFRSVAAGVLGGVVAAIVFTDPILAYFNVPADTYRIGAAAILALTGESLMRIVVSTANDPVRLVALWKAWRGQK